MISISKIFLLGFYKITPSQKLSWPTPPLAENWGDPPFAKARNLLTYPPLSSGPPPPPTFWPAPYVQESSHARAYNLNKRLLYSTNNLAYFHVNALI